MLVTIFNIFPVIINAIFDAFYISCWFCFLGREFYVAFVYPLKKEIEDLKNKQDILCESISKLKNISDIDNVSTEELRICFKDLKAELDSMYRSFGKRIDKIEEDVFKSETNTSEDQDQDQDQDEDEDEDYEEESNLSSNEDTESEKNNTILPIQNHITFPHFTIFDDINIKQTKLNKNNTKVKILSDKLKLLSYDLIKYLNIEPGTCMETDEVHKIVIENFKKAGMIDKKNKIRMIPKLQKLFGISENEDYEITVSNLTSYLAPHLKEI
jgi:hypothetical protein